ncbi:MULTISPECIES: iron ABC transporter permease [Streptomyces]|uniref:Iron ABC transporter permease n=1 Tax=Streptomyces rhizosphaericola TaxID=2564098 RepID=A0ABY2PMN8_9ACTN|nr:MULTISPECIES: iron ABC transporter permease [Streptomyces]MYT38182.1 iron chelate uptake ABC transporter family permease subunit [Streptomyces sp. SID8356]MYT99552.1 iron chelate uptake ABC transporter family permease subunit [Streptomyces sp. SID8350]NGO82775.1 iron chelate uptake ABC transporter family permease subunit [Streptomyces sp. 196(2019)]TGZ12294.1 iron ABC transporter permease [Streptomyces rhizosphaericola]SCK20954.1 iron complex transport system permease protein [Streptomyces 
MSTTAVERPAPRGATEVRRGRIGGLCALAVGLALAAALSLAVGARALSPAEVWHGLFAAADPDQRLTEIRLIVQTVRVPRTVLAVVAGIALGVGGALIQGYTRNPIADTGLLGVNTGASFAVVTAIAVFGFTNPFQYVWFAFAGAALAGVVVFGLASIGRGAGNPLTLALAGQGITVFLMAMTTAVALTDQKSLNALRFWNAGSVAGVGFDVIWPVTGFIALGLVLALSTLPSLNLLNLGDDVARGLGVNILLSRAVGILAITLLAGAATAACGPIAFLGLMVAHVARYLTGPDYRWLVPYAGLLGAVVLLVCDIVGRLVVRPGELEPGVVVALLGAPFFAVLVWRGKFKSA